MTSMAALSHWKEIHESLGRRCLSPHVPGTGHQAEAGLSAGWMEVLLSAAYAFCTLPTAAQKTGESQNGQGLCSNFLIQSGSVGRGGQGGLSVSIGKGSQAIGVNAEQTAL